MTDTVPLLPPPLLTNWPTHCDQPVAVKQRTLCFRVYLSEYHGYDQAYCCILYHPLKSVMFTPTSYPIDEIHIIYNDLLKEQCVYEMPKEKWMIILSDTNSANSEVEEAINIQAQWDQVTSYHMPIFDASESWDFVFSKSPINADLYLDGYVHQYGNVYAREKDLIEQEKRAEELQRFLR